MSDTGDFDLVMPFVVCESVGGPYADDAFTAGYRCGLLDQELSTGPVGSCTLHIEPELLPQVDLIAMRHGYEVVAEPSETPSWVFVTLRKVRA